MSLSPNSQNLSLDTKRHSMAHIMAAAVGQMFPEAQYGVGPVIENGCYYDFILPRTLIPEDLPLLEEKMSEMLKQHLAFKVQEVSIIEAIELFEKNNQPLKVELLNDLRTRGTTSMSLEEKENFELSESLMGELKITIYRLVNESTGEIVFEDLCKGPHIGHVKELKHTGFALDKFSASYWRGDQERDIRMQRIYALVFETKEELADFQSAREEAKKRDHRLIGEQMDLFTFSELIGPGLPIWLPKGRAIQMVLEKWAEQTEKEWGYKFVSTPIITKENLFYTSTHLPHYKDSMYSAMDIDGEKYYIKPMNCPFHHQAFAARNHSYRDLPLRLSEYGFCHRYENSGALFGLMRVRAMKMNDAHIYCSRDQAVQEFVDVIKLHQYYYDVLGIKDYFMELALRNPENDKYHGDEQMWKDAEDMTKKAMEIANVPFVVEKDGAAFYGPKVDFQIKSSIGRAFTASTNQIDLFMPTRFGLEFVNEKGEKETPVVIHRAPLGTHERFIGFLIEHFGGRFPFWLAPTQVKILTINTQPETLEYVEKVKEILNETVLMKPLKYNEIRFEVDDRSESLGKKIREAELQKIPVLIIVGPKDIAEGQVSVRTQEGESKVGLDGLGEFLKQV
jgi:threonyl-tRNA synthetase